MRHILALDKIWVYVPLRDRPKEKLKYLGCSRKSQKISAERAQPTGQRPFRSICGVTVGQKGHCPLVEDPDGVADRRSLTQVSYSSPGNRRRPCRRSLPERTVRPLASTCVQCKRGGKGRDAADGGLGGAYPRLGHGVLGREVGGRIAFTAY